MAREERLRFKYVEKRVGGGEMKITYSFFSDKGDRKVNEDYTQYAQYEGKELFLLADGLGGHGQGDVASKFVLNTIAELFSQGKTDLPSCILTAQEGLLEEQRKRKAKESMKTTMTALLLENNIAKLYHVGDSRGYFFQGKKLKFRTLDHSIPQMLVASGEIEEKDIRNHPDRNRLIRVMGISWEEPKFQESEEFPLKGKESFLLCSDGFWEYIEEKQMKKILAHAKTAEEWVLKMAEEVLKNGHKNPETNMDNHSAVGVFVRKK